MNCSYDEFDVHNVAPLDIHAYITTTPYPGTQLFQHHWIASHVHVYFRERIRLHDIVHLDDMSVFAQSYRGKFIGISRLREGWADIKIRRQGPGKAVPYILTIPTDFIQLSMFWRLKLKYLERLRPNHFVSPELLFFNQPTSRSDDSEDSDTTGEVEEELPFGLASTLDLVYALDTVERVYSSHRRQVSSVSNIMPY
ncbi:hypothetical protein EV424DRAFT_1546819 [Suillus variegatus]|nr:hypothetical protein EV424DRAFT_1546819 [Suillus variegatus]